MPSLELIHWDRVASYSRYQEWSTVYGWFTDGGVSLLSGRVFTVGQYHHTQRQCFIAPYACEQWAAGPRLPADYWTYIICGEYGPCGGRTLVDPSKWNVPETVMVEPFSEVGMVTQISAILSITEPHCRASCSNDSLPTHLQVLAQEYLHFWPL